MESQIFPKRISIKYLSSAYVLALQVAMSTKYETYRKTLFPKSTNGELSNNLPIALVIEKKLQGGTLRDINGVITPISIGL